MNKVILIGHLTRDVDFRKGENDKAVARFSIAVNRRFKNSEGEYEADFPSCVAFGKTAEFVNKYFKKGSAITVEGGLRTGSYEKDGQKIYTTDVAVESVEFAGSKGGGEAKSSSDEGSVSLDAIETTAVDGSEDDLPF